MAKSATVIKDESTQRPICPDCKRVMRAVAPHITGVGKYTNRFVCFHMDKIPDNVEKVEARVITEKVNKRSIREINEEMSKQRKEVNK